MAEIGDGGGLKFRAINGTGTAAKSLKGNVRSGEYNRLLKSGRPQRGFSLDESP
jgi:hypothetical protein